jgi:hypothetical protein
MMRHRRTGHLIAVLAAAVGTAIATAPLVVADPVTTLTRAVDAARGASRCAPLQSDPLVERATQMATQQTSDYIGHRSPAVPFTDPMQALKTIGYTGSKAILLSGYGMSEADAAQGLILQGHALIPDCQYTQYGVDAMRDSGGFNLTSVILAAP